MNRLCGNRASSPTNAVDFYTVNRVHGENNDLTLKMRSIYGQTLYEDPGATLDDLREAVTTLEDVTRIARRVLGGAHPLTTAIELDLKVSRAALRVREEETPSGVRK